LRNQAYSRQRHIEALSLYEQALRLDPSSVLALTGAAAMLLDLQLTSDGWRSFEARRRVEALLARARDIAPASEEYRGVYAYWLSGEDGGCRQSMVALRSMIETYANPYYGYGLLGGCLVKMGRSEEAIPLMEKAIRLNPFGPGLHTRLSVIGEAHLFLGHDDEAIQWLERTLSANQDQRDNHPGGTKRKLAAAYARAGTDGEARRVLVLANKDWPFDTVRGHWPDDPNRVFAAQVRAYQEGLRRAGERDHADEDADFGLPADADLRADYAGRTPATAPGTTTIRTADLPHFLAERKPLVIDPLLYFWGRSLPGAIGLRYAGIGGALTDEAQERLGRAMSGLTGGDLAKPIVAVGWNSERFDGRNLALRLVALGYTNVVWYRGGREAWEVANLPETELVPRDW
jgi:tetratricopeptide (TPR) repeat protein